MSKEDLLLFGDSDKPSVESAWAYYEEGLKFNDMIKLSETVKANEDFYIGKQWEGVQSNGLPTPVYNYLKRVVGFIVSSITSDRITVMATQLAAAGIEDKDYAQRMLDVVNNEFKSIIERVGLPKLSRALSRNAAVDGDGCLYTYWNPDIDTGMTNGGEKIMGAIEKEVIENDRVFFGNPQSRDVQSQPYIQISDRVFVRDAKKRAKENGSKDWDMIAPDKRTDYADKAAYQINDKKVTTILTLWKNEETGTVWAFESTQNAVIKKAYDTGCKRYHIAWLNWDTVKDCYHGQAMITGLIPNQIFVNKMWAMIQLSCMRSAFGKVIFDKTRVMRWDNAVGSAIPVNGNVDGVAKNIDPPPISPQVAQLLQLAIEMSEQNMGATAVAMGDTRPDNTSAIIALQRASNTPHELTKQNQYDCIEESCRDDLDLMTANYGERPVLVPPTEREREAYTFINQAAPETVTVQFDFSQLANHPFTLKLDVGASTYWSETASIQTMDNLLQQGKILTSEYLERLPEDFMPMKRELYEAVKAREDAFGLSAPLPGSVPGTPPSPTPEGGEGTEPLPGGQPGLPNELTQQAEGKADIPTGSGNGSLQRAIARTGQVPPEIL